MPSNQDQRDSVRVRGRDYQVPIPNRAGWSPNAPPRKGMNWCPSPRMKGETAELSKLMQNEREEKTTSMASVSKKRESGRRLKRKENAKVGAKNVVATVQVQVHVAPKPGDNLLKATAETEVITAMIGVKPGENLFREKKRGRPCKELLQQQQDQVLQNLHFKLNRFTPTDKIKFVLERFDEMLDSIILSLLKGGGQEKKEKVPTKKAADKKAAEDAMTKAAAGAVDADKKSVEATNTEAVVGPEPEAKEVATGSAVAFDSAPEESLFQIAELKEEKSIVVAVVILDAVEQKAT